MGWNPFESEKKTIIQVATQVTRVIDDDATPDSVFSGALKSIFQDGNLTDFIMEELISSVGVRAERMYNYAEDHYTHGLPSGEVYSSSQGRQQVEEVIELLEGKQVSLEYVHFGAPNALHIGWMKLVSDYGYNYESNELGSLTLSKGYPCYLKDMVVVVPANEVDSLDPFIYDQFGTAARGGYTPERPLNTGEVRNLIAPSAVRTSTTATDTYLLVTYTRKVNRTYIDESFSIAITNFNLKDGYFHAKYSVDGETKFWMYKNDSGTYPTLDAVFVEQPAVNGSYFPFLYFRYGKVSGTANKTTQAYKTSARLARYLGMDYDTITDAVNENPSIADVEQAILMFGVPPVSSNVVQSRYLFDYFDNMHAATGGNPSLTSGLLASSVADANTSAFGVLSKTKTELGARRAVRIADKRFAMTFANNGIYKRIRTGSIGAIGHYTSSYGSSTVPGVSVDVETGEESLTTQTMATHRYRHQISANLYEEILVTGLRLTYNIWGGYSTHGTGTSSILLIPVDKTISQNYSIKDREVLYARSMHFVFNSLTITEVEVKWYQQSWFRAFLVVVAIVVTIASYGTDGGSAIATALGLTGTAGLIATIVVTLAIGALMPKVFRLFVKAFGQEVATLLAVAAIVYGAYTLSTQGVAGVPMASDMLMLSSGLQTAIIEDKFSDLMGNVTEFQAYVDQQTKTLEESQKLLENKNVLSPFVIFGEKPEDYFNRTVHYGNIGTLGITAVSSYVDIALTLPKIQDTLGEPLNEPI